MDIRLLDVHFQLHYRGTEIARYKEQILYDKPVTNIRFTDQFSYIVTSGSKVTNYFIVYLSYSIICSLIFCISVQYILQLLAVVYLQTSTSWWVMLLSHYNSENLFDLEIMIRRNCILLFLTANHWSRSPTRVLISEVLLAFCSCLLWKTLQILNGLPV